MRLNEFDADVLFVFLPITAEKLNDLSEAKLRKLMLSAFKELKLWNVTRAILTRAVKSAYAPVGTTAPGRPFNIDGRPSNIDGRPPQNDAEHMGIQIVTGEQAFYRLIPQAVQRAYPMLNTEKLKSKLGISDRGMSKITEYLIDRLCFDSKYISVYTDNLRAAAVLRDEVFDRTGLTIGVGLLNAANNNTDVFIDVDRRKIRIGRDIFVDGFEADIGLEGYDVDSLELCECFGLKDIKIKYLRNGNKRLTI